MSADPALSELFAFFEQFQPLSAADRAAVQNCTRRVSAADGEAICRQGEVCPEFFFVHSGIARAWYLLPPGPDSSAAPREITGWLSFPGDVAGCFPSMVAGVPAEETIAMIGAGQLTALHYLRMQAIAEDENRMALFKLSLRLVEWSYLRLEQRLVALQATSAAERLRDLLAREAHVLEQVPHYQIASYLGITPETLSRTKAKLFA